MEVSIKIKDSEVLFSGPLCVVRGVLSVKSGGKVSSGSVLQSDWLSAGAEGEAFRLEVSSARSMQGYTRTGVSDGSILSYGKEDLFFRDADKNHVPDIKLGYQLTKATGKFRVALKVKSSFGG